MDDVVVVWWKEWRDAVGEAIDGDLACAASNGSMFRNEWVVLLDGIAELDVRGA